jgi:hypothetical protein
MAASKKSTYLRIFFASVTPYCKLKAIPIQTFYVARFYYSVDQTFFSEVLKLQRRRFMIHSTCTVKLNL